MRSPRSFPLRLFASLVGVALALIAAAGPFADADAALRTNSENEVVEQAVAKAGMKNDPNFTRWRASKSVQARAEALDALRRTIAGRAVAERAEANPADTTKVVEIKRDPFFRDAGVGKGQSAFSRWLEDLIKKLFQPKHNEANPSAIGLFGPLSQLIVWLVWLIVAGVVIAILVFALRQITWKRKLRRKATTMLEEDEPERSRDEWLTLADEFATQGRFREAIRALYVACLLQFDENRVARFDRGQTNWEHLSRVIASPRRPTTIDFETLTKRFDVVWYGHAPCGPRDVDEFRRAYEAIKASGVEEAA